MKKFIFGGNTGLTLDDLKKLRQREYASIGQNEPSFGSGIRDIGSAIATAIYDNKMKKEAEKAQEYQSRYGDELANMFNSQPQSQQVPQYYQSDTAEKEITSSPLPDANNINRNNYPANFDDSFDKLMKVEGGYVAKDGKSGHPANFGINQGANPDIDVKSLTADKAKELYRNRYWDAIDASSLPPEMQYPAFDTAVNHGVGFAKNALKNAGNSPDKLLDIRQEAYNNLAKDPEHAKNLNGWNKRLADIKNMYANNSQAVQEPMFFTGDATVQEEQPYDPFSSPERPQAQQQRSQPDMRKVLGILSSPYANDQQKAIASMIVQNKMSEMYPDQLTQLKIKGQEIDNQNALQSVGFEKEKQDLLRQKQQLEIASQQSNDARERQKLDILMRKTDAEIAQNEARANSYKAQAENISKGTWSKPYEVIDDSGGRVLVKTNNKTGETVPVDGFKPTPPVNKGVESYQRETGKTLAQVDNAVSEYEANAEKMDDISKRLAGDEQNKGLLEQVPYGAWDNAGVAINRVLGRQSPAGDAEAEARSLLKGITLDSLRSTFGGNPTEGERKELADTIIDLNASPMQRLEALKRYIDMSKMEYEGNLRTQQKLRGVIGMGGQSQGQPQQRNQAQGGGWRF